MQYRNNKKGEPISILGYGCMRFSRNGREVDIDKACKEVEAAVEMGVNYFDTAYIYKDNEVAVGKIMKRLGCRKRVNIATKLPHYLAGSLNAVDRYFNEELKRLQTDYIDYYLIHMLTDIGGWNKLKKCGIEQWIADKKAEGSIRNIGFSFHGNSDTFIEVLDAYDWDFCQIQYNYMDEVTQAGVIGLKAAAKKNIPVIIMEPLRGGRLVNLLPEKAKKLIAEDGRSAAELGFRWLWNQPEVTCVLSGMNSMDMVLENCRIADEARAFELGEKDFELYEKIKSSVNEHVKVPCTGCRYCMPCPQGVDIPGAFRCYNEMFTENKKKGRVDYMKTVGLRRESVSPSKCVECGRCEKICPQGIHVMTELKNAGKALLPLPYAVAGAVGRRFFTAKD